MNSLDGPKEATHHHATSVKHSVTPANLAFILQEEDIEEGLLMPVFIVTMVEYIHAQCTEGSFLEVKSITKQAPLLILL